MPKISSDRGLRESGAFGGSDELAARAVHFDAQLAYVFADARAGFDDGLVQLVLHLFRDVRGSRGDELADVRTQFARRGINNLEFFFDADGKAVSHGVALRVSWSCRGLRASYHTPGRLKKVPLRLVAALYSIWESCRGQEVSMLSHGSSVSPRDAKTCRRKPSPNLAPMPIWMGIFGCACG